MLKKFIAGVALAVACVSGWPLPVAAVGVGVNPASLEVDTGTSGQATATLNITNPSNEPGLFAISADDQAAWFTFSPAEVRLEAGETRAVEVQVHPSQTGRFVLQLSVLGYPLDTRAFKAASGLKVPNYISTTVVNQSNQTWRIIGIGLLVVAVLGAATAYVYYWRRRTWWQRLKNKVHFW